MIDRYLEREYRPKEVGRYYPSEIGSCLRKIWFSYKYPKETEADLIKIFEAGNILHDFMVKVLKSERNPEVELLQSEVPFKLEREGFVISGRVDDLLLLKTSGKSLLAEVKSCKSLHYIERPMPHNFMQLQLYMFATGVHEGILVYIEKNTLQTKVFEIPYDEKVGRELLERFARLHSYFKEGKIPEPEAKQNKEMNWNCNYCEYRQECDEIDKGNFNSLKLKEPDEE
jgi:CRISPR-associated exonuclease Cas4